MEQIIYLDPADDMAVVRDRLEWAQSQRVILVLPKKCALFQNSVNLRLLLRYAASAGVEIALVTRDRVTRELARENGLATFGSVERGQRARRLTRPDIDEVSLAGDGGFVRRRMPVPRSQAQEVGRWGQFGLALILVGVVGVLLFGVALLVLPSAQVSVALPSVDVSATLPIRVSVESKDVSEGTADVLARDIRVEVKGNARTNVTSQKDAPDAKAQGQIVFTNKTNAEVTLRRGVVIATSTGVTVRFQTVETITVPSGIGQKAAANIEAVEPGPKGNVDAFVINRVEGLEGLQVTAVNEQPTSGGTVKRVLVVSNEDRARVRSLLIQRLQQEGIARLQAELEEQELLLPETLLTIPISEVYDKFVDEVADELGLDMNIVFEVLAIKGEDANALILGALEAQVPQGMALVPATLLFQPGQVSNFQDGRAVLMMSASGSAAPVVDEGALIAGIRGKPLSSAAQYLQEQLGLENPPKIQLQNAWLGRLPLLNVRIQLHSSVGDGS